MIEKFHNYFGGRTMAFAYISLVLGSVLAFIGKLLPSYAALIGALATIVTARSVAQDFTNNK